MKIRIWSDFACPFCYIGETSLLRAVSELGIKDLDLEFKAFELDPDMPEDLVEAAPDHFMRVAGLTYDHALGRISKVSRFARMAGLSFRYADTRYCRTLDAHRLVVDPAKVLTVVRRLFEAFFTEALVISDHQVLKHIASEAGLDPAAAGRMFASEAYISEVRADESQARLLGLDTVPYTFIGSCQPVRGAVRVVKEVVTADDDAPSASSHTCGPDGCLL